MRGKITLDVMFCQSEEGFSLDEFIFKLREVFESGGFSELTSLMLKLVQEVLIHRLLSGHHNYHFCCCEKGSYRLHGSYIRSIKTSLGEIKMIWYRVRCRSCGKIFVPLKEFLGISRYQRHSHELEKAVQDAVVKDSYRRAVETLNSTGFVSVSCTSAHRWIMETDSDEFKISGDVCGSIGCQVIGDSTKFKVHPESGKKQGNLKVLVGVDGDGNVFPLGSWSNKSWEEISEELKEHKIRFPGGSVLVSDGEPGLSEALSEGIEFEQRCHWHIVRDLYHTMWQDGGKIGFIKPIQKALSGAIGIELPEEDFSMVSEEEKDAIEERMEKVERAIEKLIEYLEVNRYEKAANYLKNCLKNMFSYIKRWLKYGLICPRASSLIERLIRELGRRLKKIAYNWSDRGAGKIARIILKKITAIEQWEEYWNKKMKIIGSVFVRLANYKPVAQNLGH